MSNASSERTTSQSRSAADISWKPWLALLLVVIIYFVSQYIVGFLLSVYPLVRHFDKQQLNHFFTDEVAVQFLFILLVEAVTVGAILWFLRYRRASLRSIGLRRPRWSDAGWALLVVPVYYLTYLAVVIIATHLAPSLNVNQKQQTGFDSAKGSLELILTFLSLVILPPIAEEIMMRGFLYSTLRKYWKRWAAVGVTSLLFAAAHLQFGSGAPLLWIAAIDTFILSLALIFLRERTGGLWASMLLHAMKNLVAFMSLFILK